LLTINYLSSNLVPSPGVVLSRPEIIPVEPDSDNTDEGRDRNHKIDQRQH